MNNLSLQLCFIFIAQIVFLRNVYTESPMQCPTVTQIKTALNVPLTSITLNRVLIKTNEGNWRTQYFTPYYFGLVQQPENYAKVKKIVNEAPYKLVYFETKSDLAAGNCYYIARIAEEAIKAISNIGSIQTMDGNLILKFTKPQAPEPSTMPEGKAPQFELYNKSSIPLEAILSTDTDKFWDISIEAGKKHKIYKLDKLDKLDTKPVNLILKLFYKDKNARDNFEVFSIRQVKNNETVYLSFDPEKSKHLYPQTGKFYGLIGESDSGYPLGRNIQSDRIR